MTLTQLQGKALELPVAERRQLAEAIWESLHSDSEPFPLTDARQALLDRRRAEYLAKPDDALTWEQLQTRLDDLS